jgi:hypothetical protein
MNHLKLLPVLLLSFAAAAPVVAQPFLHIDRANGPARLSLETDPGPEYRLEGSSTLPPGWEFLATLQTPGGVASWYDAQSAQLPQRFYRAIQQEAGPAEVANDFRLLDQLGRTRRLYYYYGAPGVRSIVLIFAGNGCAKLREMAPAINALTNRFASQGVLFWLIDSNTGDTRSNILVEATSLGWSNSPPILHDTSQVVARSFNAQATTEAIAIDVASYTVFYRGAIDDRIGTTAATTTQHYLSNALTGFLAGGAATVKESRPVGCDIKLSSQGPVPSYSTEIAPLLQNKCVACHSPGNIAPWSMTNHSVVAFYADSIRDNVMRGDMPPWHADPAYGGFTNDKSLSPSQISRLVQWLDAGAPRGTGSDPLAETPPPATNYPYAWPTELGPPDAILRIPLQNVPATGTVDYRYINVSNTAFTNDVWLRAAIVRPTNTRVVHHCLVFQGTGGLMGLDGFFTGYVPGFDATTYPAGTAKRLRKGETLRFQMHYTTVGTPQTDQTEIGLYKMDTPPQYDLQTKSAYNLSFVLGGITIPANRNEFEITAQYPSSGTLTTNIMLYEMSPHMHLRGSRFKYEAFYPDGKREILLSVPYYIFHWQALYRLSQPRYLPKGSRIVCTAAWDNTTQNVELMNAYETSSNPLYLPDHVVTFNEQSWDEMFIGYMNYAEVP